MKFKIGDLVKVVDNIVLDHGQLKYLGTTATIEQLYNSGAFAQICTTIDNEIHMFNTRKLELVNNKENNMSISETLRDNKLDADTKLLIEKGIINRDGTLTDEGKRVTADYAFAANKAAILTDIRGEQTPAPTAA